MRKFYRISGNLDHTLSHLAGSAVLSFCVMMFINLFIGGMGGLPAFAGFFVVFYLLRGLVIAGGGLSHQLAMTSRREVQYFLVRYGLWYLAVWGVMKLVHLVSRISGWGNIDGLSFGEYLNHIYGSTMTERWAYLVAGILMAAYVASLFPLVMIRRYRDWGIYLLACHMFFAVVCGLLAVVCRFSIPEGRRRRGNCVLDDLLLCSPPERWQAAACIVAALLLAVAVLLLVYRFGVRVYAPRPGRIGYEILPVRHLRDYRAVVIGGTATAAALIAALGLFFFGSRSEAGQYRQVAVCLTEDLVLGPMSYGGRVYVPVYSELQIAGTGEALGYLGRKEEDCDSRFYELVVANLLYEDRDRDLGLLQLEGSDYGMFRPLEQLLSAEEGTGDEVFLLWDEDWEAQTAYSNATGYSVCEDGLVELLQGQFSDLSLRPKDFAQYDAYFTIRGYPDMKAAFRGEPVQGDWAGCILVKDDRFYFCNYGNEVTGAAREQLMDTLGGNEGTQ